MRTMTVLGNAITGILVTAPEALRARYGGITGSKLATTPAATRPTGSMTDPAVAVTSALRDLARARQDAAGRADKLEQQLDALLQAAYPRVLAIYEVGTISAAKLVATAGEIPSASGTRPRWLRSAEPHRYPPHREIASGTGLTWVVTGEATQPCTAPRSCTCNTAPPARPTLPAIPPRENQARDPALPETRHRQRSLPSPHQQHSCSRSARFQDDPHHPENHSPRCRSNPRHLACEDLRYRTPHQATTRAHQTLRTMAHHPLTQDRSITPHLHASRDHRHVPRAPHRPSRHAHEDLRTKSLGRCQWENTRYPLHQGRPRWCARLQSSAPATNTL